ncbi:MAG: hypothetical protein ACMG6H_13530 [Acidobacteriota bacterium]
MKRLLANPESKECRDEGRGIFVLAAEAYFKKNFFANYRLPIGVMGLALLTWQISR